MPLSEEEIAALQAERDKTSQDYWSGAPGATSATAIDLDASSYYGGGIPGAMTYGPEASIPGAMTYGPEAKIPGAATYDANAKIPGAIDYAIPPPGREMAGFARGGPGGDPYAPPPTGPTPADDAAFERAKSQVSPRPTGSAAGGAISGNADPFGVGAANKALMGSFDQMRAAREHAGTAESDKLLNQGLAMKHIADMKEYDSYLAQSEQDEFSKRFDDQMRQAEEQLANVRAKKINVDDYVETHGGSALAAIGGMLGGLYQGVTKGARNPFLDQLNTDIDRWIGAQEKNIANERAGVVDKMNLLQQQRTVFKDSQLAKLQLKNMAYEAAKERAAGDAADSDSEIAKAHAEDGIATINQAQAQLRKQIAERAQAVAAQGAAAAVARQKERATTFKETYKEALGQGMSPAQAEHAALRVTAYLYAPQELERLGPVPSGGEYDGMTVRDRSHMKREEAVAQKEAEAELAALRDFKTKIPKLSAGSAVGDYWSGAPGFLPGVSSAKEHKLDRESYNATVARAYDAAMKAAQGAAPTESQKAQLKTFYLENNDGDEDVARKINAAEEFVIQAGRAKGLKESTPNETAKALGEKPIR